MKRVRDHRAPPSPRSAWSPAIVVAIATGGVIGATGRWAAGAALEHDAGTWPWSTLLVNLVGSLLIGLAARELVAGTTGWAFAVTGLLGGFTTFSAFAVELNDLVDAGRGGLAGAYATVTLIGGVVATALAGAGEVTEAVEP